MMRHLLHEIHEFLAETGMGPTYFGQLAASNTTLVQRLESGRTVSLITAERVRAFMADERKRAGKGKRRRGKVPEKWVQRKRRADSVTANS